MKQHGKSISSSRPDVWQDKAVCVDAPERDKQALTGSFPTKEIALDMNKRYCSRCPVKTDCLNWAWDEGSFSGIAGGMAFVGDKSTGKNRRVVSIVEGK